MSTQEPRRPMAPPASSGRIRRWIDRRWALRAYLALNLPLMIGVVLTPMTPTSVFRSVIATLSVVTLIAGVRWQRPDVPVAWRLLTAGAAVSAVAVATGSAMRYATGGASRPAEWNSPLVFALCFPLFIAGLALLGRLSGRAYAADMLDAVVVALATFLLLFGWVIDSILPPGSVGHLASVVYPLGALLLFAMVVRVALSVGLASPALRLLLLSMTAFVAATMSLLVPALSTGSVDGNSLTSYLLSAGSILLGAAALHPSLSRTRVRVDDVRDTASRPRMLLFAVLAAAAPIAWAGEVWRAASYDTGSVVVLLTAAPLLLVLLVARLGLTAGEAQRRAAELARRSDDLAAAGREQEALHKQLRYLALHDPLTGLPNRVVLADRMRKVLSRSPQSRPHTLAFIDLDRFKDVNDTLGHAVGDELLVEISQRLLAATPEHATLARLGGDEFAVLLKDTGTEEAGAWAQGILRAVRQPCRVGEHELFVSTSVGLFTAHPHRPSPTPAEVLRDADLALYAAKAEGRNRVATFSPQLRDARMRFSRMSAGLRRALDGGELEVHYQPVVHLATGRITAVEALLRWNPPGQSGSVPAEFIPVAEETGMIGPIGAWVLRQACRQARSWYERHRLAMAVNVSARQLDDPGFADLVIATLGDAGLPGSALILEITENSLVATSGAADAMSQLQRLRSEGVRVAIDDFGTGYSSLSYVSRLPVDIVKIDSSFVQNPTAPAVGRSQWSLTRAILHLVNTMRLEAIAEGVETAEQAEALRRLRCPLAQGFLFARPMPAEAVERALADPDGTRLDLAS